MTIEAPGASVPSNGQENPSNGQEKPAGGGRRTEPSLLTLPRVGDSERLVRARGSLFLVTTPQGDIAPAGARELGLFLRDTRFLSHYELEVSSGSAVRLSAETGHPAFNQVDLMLSDDEREEALDDPTNFFHIRRRQMLDGGLIEEIVLTNFLMRRCDIQIAFTFESDFADIFEVRGAQRPKRGTTHEARVEGSCVTLSYTGLCGTHFETVISFGLKPSELTEKRAVFDVSLASDRNLALEVRVTPRIEGTTRGRPGLSFARCADAIANEEQSFRAASTRYLCDDGVLQSVLDRAIADLFALRVQFDQHSIVGAGIPWFCAPFGRDSLITAYEALTLNPDFAIDTLRTLAAFQGEKFDEVTEEEPGKIFHELRFGEMAICGEIPHSPYYGSIDSTPLFVIVAEATHRFAHDRALLRELRPAIEGAVGWMDARSAKGTELVRYQRKSTRGLLNQGWKDSQSGVSFPDGRRAVPPIALIEVQGYCADAYLRAGRMFRELGDEEASKRCEHSAQTMVEMINRRFWMEEANRYAYAIDGHDRLLPTIVSNIGHLLWSRVAPADRATSTARMLLASSSFSGFGIRTLASEQPVYNPLSYHNGTVWPHDNAIVARGFVRYGLHDEALKVFDGLYAAMTFCRDYRLPELFCGIGKRSGPLVRYPVACSPQAWASAAPLLLLQAILGLRVDAPAGRLVIRNPKLPRTLRKIELQGLRIGSSLVDVGFKRVGTRCHVDKLHVTGGPLKTEIELDSGA